ncbi:hypothetical protein BD414DRAFT_298079 [Trametes punicea]|nr:hypothetical protein BD414DRAFT_298079 [Trametes punicea]
MRKYSTLSWCVLLHGPSAGTRCVVVVSIAHLFSSSFAVRYHRDRRATLRLHPCCTRSSDRSPYQCSDGHPDSFGLPLVAGAGYMRQRVGHPNYYQASWTHLNGSAVRTVVQSISGAHSENAATIHDGRQVARCAEPLAERRGACSTLTARLVVDVVESTLHLGD